MTTVVPLIPISAPRKSARREPLLHTGTVDNNIAIALALSRDFPDAAPSLEHLEGHYGMTRTTACRWLRAWQKVKSP